MFVVLEIFELVCYLFSEFQKMELLHIMGRSETVAINSLLTLQVRLLLSLKSYALGFQVLSLAS